MTAGQYDGLGRPHPPRDIAGRAESIADGIADLLEPLPVAVRRGLLARLSRGYYDGWRPGREEVADLVAVEIGVFSWDTAARRQRQRAQGGRPESVVPTILGSRRRAS